MINLSYSVTESIYRRYGRIRKLVYDYEENQENYELDLLTQKQDYTPKYRHYQAIIYRDEYEYLIETDMSETKQFCTYFTNNYDGYICWK